MPKVFSCYILGEESLATQCAEFILAQGHQLLGIVSSKPAIKEWTHNRLVRYIDSASPYEELLLKTNFDYLFSIVNPYILPAALLKKPQYLAINYHDALLPRYAGVNATSWAILNHEKQHGISWHVMNEQVDAGDILKQAVITVEENETALSLNLKCYQAALETFKELIIELSNQKYIRTSQDLTQRTYYAYQQKPPGNGLIAWKESAQNLARFYRAVRFGDYPNRLSVLKMQIGKQSYVVDQLKPLEVISTQFPGTLVNLDKGLQIATRTNDILITQLKTLDNRVCDLHALIQQHHLKPNKKLPLPSSKHQYAYQKISTDLFKHEDFWLQQLLSFKPVMLPFWSDECRPKAGFDDCLFTLKLSTALQQSLQNLFSTADSTAQILLTTLLIYLQRISSEETVSVSFTYPNLLTETQCFTALIANFVPLNIFFEPGVDFATALSQVKQQHTIVKQRKTYLQDVYVRYPELSFTGNTNLIGIIYSDTSQAISLDKLSYPIIILIEENRLSLYINRYINNKNLLNFLANLHGHLQNLLTEIMNNPNQAIYNLPLLTPAEQQKILVDWNNTITDYPRNKTVTQLFAEQVEKTPDNVAVVFEDSKLTYRELDQKANQLACFLQKRGVKPNMPVAICLERGLEMMVGMLAIIKVGAIYLPLDPDYPQKRIQNVIQDSQAKFIVVQKNTFKKFDESLKKKSIFIEEIAWNENLTNYFFREPKISSNAPIYLIYTSGSTGTPKGVLISHRSLINLVNNNCININQFDSVTQTSNITFDIAMFEIWGALLNGSKLVIIPKYILLSSSTFSAALVKEHASIVFLTTALFNQIVKFNPKLFGSLNCLMIGGEKPNINIIKKFIRIPSNTPKIFLNLYGLTECTIISTHYSIKKDIKKLPYIPIGKPLSNTQCYVLDAHLQPVPIGVIGELFIGGEGVSAGYLNQPEKTQSSFIANPFRTGSNERLYRSGDKVRWLPDGNLEYIGRNDDQIKLRGFRIELGEIETALTKHPQVSQAIVLIRSIDEQRKQLEGYIIAAKNHPSSHQALIPEELTIYLKQTLPDYMIPTRFFVVDHFPLTINGKVNKQALIEQQPLLLTEKPIKAPSSPTEILLVNIWQNVLKIPQISTDDNFFLLGGDSIIAMQIAAKATQAGLQLAVQDIFQYPVISDLAQQISEKSTLPNDQIQIDKKFDLAPIQAWFFDQALHKPEYFSQVGLLTIQGAVDVALLERCFTTLLNNHDALQLRFIQTSTGKWQQYYATIKKAAPKIIQTVDSSGCDNAALQKLIEHWTHQLPQTFNLKTGPLLKAAFFYGHAKDSSKLLIVVHHLIIDGVSWRILLEELQTLYQSLSDTEKLATPLIKTSSYQTWIKSLRDDVTLNDLKTEQPFWLAIDQHAYALPIDHQHGENLEQSTQTLSVQLSEQETTTWLKELGTEIKPHEVLIALLAKTLAEWTKTGGALFDLETHGREPLAKPLNLSQTVGWFTSLFSVYLIIPTNATLWEISQSIKDQLQKIPHHGRGYGLLRYQKQLRFLHQAQVAFNYWGQFDQIFDQQNFKFDSLELVSHPNNKRAYLLNVDGMVKNKQLTISWTYSVNFHQQSTIARLAQAYIDDLRTLLKAQGQTEIQSIDCSLLKLPFEQIKPYLTEVETIQGVYPLCPLQQGLLFHAIQAPASEAYMVQLLWHIPTELDLCIDSFIQAWQSLIDRHPVLRTFFLWEELAEPVQVVRSSATLPWNKYNWANGNEQNEQQLESFLHADRQVGFNFSSPPLLRLTVIELPQKRYYLIVTFHHILLDGWSIPILINQLDYLYYNIKQNNLPYLPQPKSYALYLDWLQRQDMSAAKDFWQNYLAGFSVATDLTITLPSINHNSNKNNVDIALEEKSLPIEFVQQLKQFCQAHHLTLSTLFQGVWALFLNRYSQSDDVVFGVTLAGRAAGIDDVENITGLFINTLPLRINLTQADSVKDYLSKIQSELLKISQYSYVSLTDLTTWSEVANGKSLFNSILVFENYPDTEDKNHWFKLNNTKIIDPTHYPLSCIIVSTDTFVIRLAYDKNIIAAESIQRLHGHLYALLTEIINHPQKNIHQLNLLTSQEQQLLTAWNNTQANYPLNKTVHQLFEEQVEKTPDYMAVIFEDQELTYGELNTRANQVAQYLIANKVKPETLVAIFMERSLEMIIGILGILKSGGAYVPIDPEYPEERVSYLLEDCKASIILTQQHIQQKISKKTLENKQIFSLDEINSLMDKDKNIENSCAKATVSNAAYVIYTSGSTGKPKGVINTHLGIVNRLLWMQSAYQLSKEDNVLQKTPLGFDVSVWELLWPLISGAKLIISKPGGHRDSQYLKNIIIEQNITTLHFVPSMLVEFLKTTNLYQCISLKRVMASGEALSFSIAKKFHKILPHVKLYNLYGPTEAAIDVTAWDCNEKFSQKIIPIGRPIANIQAYVLDPHLNPVPIGIIGELHLGGAGLARGYLHRESLTNEKFIKNPFCSDSLSKLYKTGDLVRWLANGALEYIGRNDDQIKIRGQRTELGEIEKTLEQYPDVSQACVIANKEPDSLRLFAYLISKNNQCLDTKDIHEFLRKILPSYMLPSGYLVLDKLPLTANGKIDKGSLALLKPEKLASDTAYVEPRSEIESLLVSIWSQIFDREKLGIFDNFFDLGGHSLLALKLLGLINTKFNINLRLRTLFDFPTISELAPMVESLQYEQTILDMLSVKNKEKGTDCIVALKPEGHKSPLFLIHPVGCTIFWYVGLGKYLDASRPLYAIQDPGIEAEENAIPFETMEEMASFYINLIRAIQPNGPYFLGGASSGSNVSVEMARQLRKLGEPVAFVGLFDGWVPHPGLLMNQEFFETNMRRQYHDMQEKFVSKGIFRSESLLKLQWYRLQMYAKHQMTMIDFKLTLFKAVDTMPIYQSIEDKFNHWENYSVQPIVKFVVPGDHETMFQEPNTAVLGKKLNQCLNESEALYWQENVMEKEQED